MTACITRLNVCIGRFSVCITPLELSRGHLILAHDLPATRRCEHHPDLRDAGSQNDNSTARAKTWERGAWDGSKEFPLDIEKEA